MGSPHKLEPEQESQCFECDLRNLYVPPSVAWASHDSWNFVQEDQIKEPIDHYWGMVAYEARTKSHGGSKPLREQCKMDAGLTKHLSVALHRKRKWAASASGSAKEHYHGGLFLHFHGDSFLRISMISMLRTMTREESVLQKAAFNKSTFHLGHLFCCRDYQGEGSKTEFVGCGLEFEDDDFPASEIKPIIRSRLDEGQVCVLFQFRQRWSQESSSLDEWYDGNATTAAAPDLLVVNGGLHYHDWGPNQTYEAQFDAAMAAYNRSLMSGNGYQTSMLILSSTYNSFHEWEPQRAAYEHVRGFVQDWQPAKVQSRISYIDLHTMAGVDSCGFSHRFPARKYWNSKPDACGNNFTNADIHLNGGFFLHTAELVGFTLFKNQRRCDPPPFEPIEETLLVGGAGEGNDGLAMSKYITESLSNSSKPSLAAHARRKKARADSATLRMSEDAAREEALTAYFAR